MLARLNANEKLLALLRQVYDELEQTAAEAGVEVMAYVIGYSGTKITVHANATSKSGQASFTARLPLREG